MLWSGFGCLFTEHPEIWAVMFLLLQFWLLPSKVLAEVILTLYVGLSLWTSFISFMHMVDSRECCRCHFYLLCHFPLKILAHESCWEANHSIFLLFFSFECDIRIHCGLSAVWIFSLPLPCPTRLSAGFCDSDRFEEGFAACLNSFSYSMHKLFLPA